jgi:deuterolysin
MIIPAGATVESDWWDVAKVHNMDAGGKFHIHSNGHFSFAEMNSTELSGSYSFKSNVILADVDGVTAAKVRRDFHDLYKREIVQKDCTGAKLNATKTAIANCKKLAGLAEKAARNGTAAKMEEYFKSSSTSTRNEVAQVYSKMGKECGSTSTGVSKQFCDDVSRDCSDGVLAYTMPSRSQIVNCPLYFTLPPLTKQCHRQDQATTTMHETTHLNQIKGTSDQHGAYGYKAVRRLNGTQNLEHADTYAMFANAIYAGC